MQEILQFYKGIASKPPILISESGRQVYFYITNFSLSRQLCQHIAIMKVNFCEFLLASWKKHIVSWYIQQKHSSMSNCSPWPCVAKFVCVTGWVISFDYKIYNANISPWNTTICSIMFYLWKSRYDSQSFEHNLQFAQMHMQLHNLQP